MRIESELAPRFRKEFEKTIQSDVVVVGAGVMGLIVAKRFTDLGQKVVVIDASPTLAYGASIKNHGWLHRGSVHAVSIQDKEEGRRVVEKLIYGYEYLRSYAPECVEKPICPVFAVTEQDATAARAVSVWEEFGVQYEEISPQRFMEIDEEISREIPLHIFKTADLQINTRILYQKLLADILSREAVVIKDAICLYENPDTLQVSSRGEVFSISSAFFIHSTGASIANEYEKVTGDTLPISFWKSHLLLLPRFNSHSIASLDPNCPIIINHQDVSVINRAYDDAAKDVYDITVEEEQVRLAFDSVQRYYPHVSLLKDQVEAIACVKPTLGQTDRLRHSVSSQFLRPYPNHYFVLPGKMTEAPYVADELLQEVYASLSFPDISLRPLDKFAQFQTQYI